MTAGFPVFVSFFKGGISRGANARRGKGVRDVRSDGIPEERERDRTLVILRRAADDDIVVVVIFVSFLCRRSGT